MSTEKNVPENAGFSKLAKRLILILVVALVLLTASRLRVLKVNGENKLLFKWPNYYGSGSTRHWILDQVEALGKERSKVQEILYVGSELSIWNPLNYYRGIYKDADGTETVFYGYDDSDLNSGQEAVLIWPDE